MGRVVQKLESISSRAMNVPVHSVRIAVIATSYIKQRDGVSVYIENLLAELLHQVHGLAVGIDRIDVIICQHSLATLSSLLQEQLKRLGCGEELGRIRFCPVAYTHIAWELYDVPRQLHKNGPYNLIVMPNPRPILFTGRPVLSILHDLTFKVAGCHLPTWRRFYFEFLNTWRLARDDFTGVISNSTRDAVLDHYPWCARRPMMLLPNGLPFKLAWVKRPPATKGEQKIAEGCLSCLVVGRPNYSKGFDRVINACEAIDTQLEHSDVSITLHVVGKNTSDMEQLLPHNALRKVDIKLPGYIHDEALNALYRDSAFCFFLSRNEGFGLPLIEALWFRCVPILSDLPIFREIMGDDFPLFDMEGAYGEAIADFIVRLRDDEAFRQGLLEKMERILEAHRDGYKIAAAELIKLCTRGA